MNGRLDASDRQNVDQTHLLMLGHVLHGDVAGVLYPFGI